MRFQNYNDNGSLSIYQLIGKNYERGWWTNCHCRYRCFKGARNTKKSYDIIGYEVIDKILTDNRRNVLIIRNTAASHRYSTFATLMVIIRNMGISQYFKTDKTELTITYLPTGQVILFKGMDNPQKLQGIRVVQGFLTDVYIEEAFEIKTYLSWRQVDGSIRGRLPEGLFYQITFCFNAWSGEHWLNEKFFKGRMDDDMNYLLNNNYQDYKDDNYIGDYGIGLYLHTSTYKCNEFRDVETYDQAMEGLRKVAPEIYKVEALGMWGNTTDSTYPEMNDSLVINTQETLNLEYCAYSIGIDTGLSDSEGRAIKLTDKTRDRYKSATTMQLVGLTNDYKSLVCLNEYFSSNEGKLVPKTAPQLMEEIIKKIIEWIDFYKDKLVLMKGVIPVYVDCADKGFRDGLEIEAKKQGLSGIVFVGSTKIRIQTRVDFSRLIMAYGEFKICDKCQNLIRELKASHKGQNGDCREDFDDHSINANEYAWAPIVKYLKRWANYKEH